MKNPAVLVFFPALAFSQVVYEDSGQGDAVCPLSDSQTEKSIEAFSKIVPILTREPRCVNCHGGVNPFIDGVGDPNDPTASRTEHGGGKMDEGTDGIGRTDCASCHSRLAPKRDGTPSVWDIPPRIFFFNGKDALTLCEQMHDQFREAKQFIEHLQDDRGHDNFVGTAFMGNRGLKADEFPELPPQPPRNIDAKGLVKLGRDWIATTGGEFKGNGTLTCGCKPFHYAVRMTTMTEVKAGIAQFKSALDPVDVPITFADDGSFTGEAEVHFKGQGTVAACSGQYSSGLRIRASGEVNSTVERRDMRLQLEDIAPSVNSVSGQCANGSFSRPNVQSSAQRTVLPFDMLGNVGEYQLYQMPAGPGVSSQLRVEIVQVAEPAK